MDKTRSPSALDQELSLVKKYLKEGDLGAARRLIGEIHYEYPDNLRVLELRARVDLEFGALDELLTLLAEVTLRYSSEELAGLYASARKRLALRRRRDDPSRRTAMDEALAAYITAWEKFPNSYWLAINCATLTLFSDPKQAYGFAEKTLLLLDQADPSEALRSDSEKFWSKATRGEALIIQRRYPEASECYRQLRDLAQGEWTELASVRRNLDLLVEAGLPDAEKIAALLPLPQVFVFSGHRVDEAGRSTERFPEREVDRVSLELKAVLNGAWPPILYASAASGGDILALEAAQNLAGETHVVLPFAAEEFCKTSVQAGTRNQWETRFNHVLEASSRRQILVREMPEGEMSWVYNYTNIVASGLAMLHARRIHGEIRALALLGESMPGSPGGTSDAVQFWRKRGLNPSIVWSRSDQSPSEADSVTLSKADSTAETEPEAIFSVLFADIKGYSALDDGQMVVVTTRLLSKIADLMQAAGDEVLAANTWGDGLHMIFNSARGAASFALQVRQLFRTFDFAEASLPPGMAIRISLHLGALKKTLDPIIQRPVFLGRDTALGARVEPVTPPGEVYVSENFAAVLCACYGEEFRVLPVGNLDLPKHAGQLYAYQVLPKFDAAT